MNYVYKFFGGKSTLFAWVFTVSGLIGFFKHMLSGGEFLTFAGIIHGWVAIRSIMDDKHTQNMASIDPSKTAD